MYVLFITVIVVNSRLEMKSPDNFKDFDSPKITDSNLTKKLLWFHVIGIMDIIVIFYGACLLPFICEK